MNCAIIGFGSIGARHFKILKKSNFFENIYIVSSRIKKKNFFNNINNLLDKKIDYFVVCNETHKHFETFNFIENNFSNKIVMIEKPLFHQNKFIKNYNNTYYVGYNLRFNPIVIFAKNFFSNKKVFYLDMYCKTFLPNWRIGRHYRNIYSSSKNKGGGVLNDLSHELDLMNYLFGKYRVDSSYSSRISKLNISSDDICVFFGKFDKKKIFFNVNLNFFSHIESRKFLIVSNDISAEFDLINNQIFISRKNKLKKIKFKIDRDQEYLQMHKNILFDKIQSACNLKDAQFVLKIIDKIKNK